MSPLACWTAPIGNMTGDPAPVKMVVTVPSVPKFRVQGARLGVCEVDAKRQANC
jgi:hypothetical protein